MALPSPLSCNISHLSCAPYKLPWHPNASQKDCRGSLAGAKHDVSQNLTTAVGISIKNHTTQCYNCTLRCKETLFFPFNFIYLFFYRTFIFFLFSHLQRWEGRMKRKKRTAIVAAFDKFIMSLHKQAMDAIYCQLFSVVLYMYVLFYFIAWLAGGSLVYKLSTNTPRRCWLNKPSVNHNTSSPTRRFPYLASAAPLSPSYNDMSSHFIYCTLLEHMHIHGVCEAETWRSVPVA